MQWIVVGGIAVASVLVGVVAGYGLRRVVKRVRRRRAITREHLLRIAAGLPLRDVQLETFPTLGVRGRLHGYSVSFDGVPKRDQWLWRIHAELEQPWSGRLILHGDDRPGRLKEVYGTTLVLTGDTEFDRRVITMSTNPAVAQQFLSTYVRASLLELPHLHVQMELVDQHAYAECCTAPHGVEDLAHVIEAFVLICATTDLVLRMQGDAG